MRIVYVLAGLLAVLFIAACGDEDDGGDATQTGAATTAAAAFPVTVADDDGIEFTFEEAPDAIVALAPSFVEVLYAVGAGDSIVAADENTDYPPEAADIPRVSGFSPSVEAIIAYEPDLVLMCCFDAGGLQDALTELDIPTMYFDSPATIEGVYEQIETIAEVVGRHGEAETIVTEMRTEIAAVISQLDTVDEGPSVFHEYDAELFTAGPGSFPDEVYGLLKAPNIADATGEPFPQMSNEAVIAGAPGVIILADGDFGVTPESVGARPGWDAIPAVQDARIYPVNGALLSRPTPRLVDDIQMLAELLYPEIFG
jgi:iron complex transport system substrate-binding protein